MQVDQGHSDVRRDSGEAAVQLRRALHRVEQRQRQDVIQSPLRGHHVLAAPHQKGVRHSSRKKKVNQQLFN